MSKIISICSNKEGSKENSKVSIVSHPASVTVEKGEGAGFSVSINRDYNNFRFFWFKDGRGIDIDCGAHFQLNETTQKDQGYYWVYVIDESGKVTKSEPAFLEVVGASPELSLAA